MTKNKNLKPLRPKQQYRAKLKYDTFQEAFDNLLIRNCVPATTSWDPHEPPYIESEIRIVMTALGSGYIHVLGRDSETIDFKRIGE